MFFRQTHFSLLSLIVDDDAGFPRMSLQFNTSDFSYLTVTDPNQTILFSNTYYNGIYNESISLAGYRMTVMPGKYQITAADSSKHTIFENELSFNGANLTLLSLSADEWDDQSRSSIVAVHLLVKNAGDLPAYPERLTIQQGASVADASLLPTVVLPSFTVQLTCFLSLADFPAGDMPLTISVFDNKGSILLQTQQETLQCNQVGSWEYSWFYLGQHTLKIPKVEWLFDYYHSLPRVNTVDYAAYVFDPYDDLFIQFLINQILSLKTLRSETEKINFVASFVQSIEYKNDDPENTSYEYPRYPLETLKEKRGDCEDKAILTAALLGILEYNVSLIRLPHHMAVGVHLNESLPGYSFYVDQYYYLETTTLHMTLGRVPPEYEGISNVTVYPISQRPLLFHQWKSATRFQISTGEDYVRVVMIVENLGSSEASSLEVHGAFYDNESYLYNLRITSVLFIAAGEKHLVELSVDVPTFLQEQATTLKTQLYLDGMMVNQRESTSRFP
ncbi:MAG: hypothetical protein JW840_05070 [Candidatus Thermoplasmatota archaeon]|nr:hypothetical protein [Candidatus Thermoplasmatota archaeon]